MAGAGSTDPADAVAGRPRPAGPGTAGRHNDRIALAALLRLGPRTRRQLAEHTGLSAPSVSALTRRLERRGLVETRGAEPSSTGSWGRRGPAATLFALRSGVASVGAIEVTTGGVRGLLVDLSTCPATGDLPAPDVEITLDHRMNPVRAVAGVVRDLARSAPLIAVAVAAPGLVDPRSGEVTFSARWPGWRGALRPALQDAVGTAHGGPARPAVLVENEANLAGLAELATGAAGRSFALLWIDDGLGVAVVTDGRLYRGASGGAGEVGYLTFGERTFHERAGAAAICALGRRHGLPVRRAGTRPARAAAIVALAADRHASDFLAELADRIGAGAADVCAMLDPGTIVLGGSVGAAGGAGLALAVQRRVAAAVPLDTTVIASRLGAAAPLAGAMSLAADRALDLLLAG